MSAIGSSLEWRRDSPSVHLVFQCWISGWEHTLWWTAPLGRRVGERWGYCGLVRYMNIPTIATNTVSLTVQSAHCSNVRSTPLDLPSCSEHLPQRKPVRMCVCVCVYIIMLCSYIPSWSIRGKLLLRPSTVSLRTLTFPPFWALLIWLVKLEQAAWEVIVVVHTSLERNGNNGMDYGLPSGAVVDSIKLPLK